MHSEGTDENEDMKEWNLWWKIGKKKNNNPENKGESELILDLPNLELFHKSDGVKKQSASHLFFLTSWHCS